MATRIDKKVHNLNLDSTNILSYLKKRGGRKSNEIRYTGAVRNNALSDLTDRGEALSNVLNYITRVTDRAELAIYGEYTTDDFSITKEFIENDITKTFLTPLKDVSVTDEGSEVDIFPRVRIEDRLRDIDGLTGRGQLNNLHQGATAIFYSIPPNKKEPVGTLRLTNGFDQVTGAITAGFTFTVDSSFTQPTTGIAAYTLTEYENPAVSGQTLNLDGFDVFVLVNYNSGTPTWTIGDAKATKELKRLKSNFGTDFENIVFKLGREYSSTNQPKWYSTSPASLSELTTASGPDDKNPETSDAILSYERGTPGFYVEEDYYNADQYLNYRIPPVHWGDYNGDNIVKDSNMVWDRAPRVLRDNTDNWGVRWDGYLRLDRGTGSNDLKYVFEVQTNIGVKIDVLTAGTTSAPVWTTAIDTLDPANSANFLSGDGFIESEDTIKEDGGNRFFSKESFTLSNLPEEFIYYRTTDGPAGASYRYVPISLRIWHGAADRTDLEAITTSLPNIFIRTGSVVDDNKVSKFFGEEVDITLASSTGIITNPADSGNPFGSTSTIQKTANGMAGTSESFDILYNIVSYYKYLTGLEAFVYETQAVGLGFTPGVYENIEFSWVEGTGDNNVVPTKLPTFTVTVATGGTVTNIEEFRSGENITENAEFEYKGNILGDNGSNTDPRVKYVFKTNVEREVEIVLDRADIQTILLQNATPGDNSTDLIAYDTDYTTPFDIGAVGLPWSGDGPPTPPTKFKLRIKPDRSFYSDLDDDSSLLWSSRIVSPRKGYSGYEDLFNVSETTFEPSVFKKSFENKEDYWKTLEGQRYISYADGAIQSITAINNPLDGWESNYFKNTLSSNAYQVGLYGDGSYSYSTRKNLILGEAKYSSLNKNSENYIGIRLEPNDLGEGGQFVSSALPINNALSDYTGQTDARNKTLGENDLGGAPNHVTAVQSLTPIVKQMFWRGGLGVGVTDPLADKFYLHADLTTVSASDDTTTGFQGVYQALTADFWLGSISASAVSRSLTSGGGTGSPGFEQGFAAPVPLTVERVKWNTSSNSFPTDQTTALGTNEIWLIAFSSGTDFVNAVAGTTQPRTTDTDFGGGLGGEFIKYYDDTKDIAFQYLNVDDGKSISFSDVLKITYDSSVFSSIQSEVPKPASARMTPFGEDNPAFGADLCYPPYTTSDSLLKDTAIGDSGASGLYQTSGTDYDVFWGDRTQSDLGGKILNIAQQIEFSYSVEDLSGNGNAPIAESDLIKDYTGSPLSAEDFSHRFRVGFPLTPGLDEDITEHIGNLEPVKNSYSLFVNGWVTATNSASGKLPGLQ